MAFLAILMFNLAEELLITTLILKEAECFEKMRNKQVNAFSSR